MHGVIIMDTMMEYNTSSKSQKIPDRYESAVRNYLIMLPDWVCSGNLKQQNFSQWKYLGTKDKIL